MTAQRVLELRRRIRSGPMLTIGKFAPEGLNYRPFEGAYLVGEIILHIAHEEEIGMLYGLVRRRGALSPAPALEKATPASLKGVLEAIHRERSWAWDRLMTGSSRRMWDLPGEARNGGMLLCSMCSSTRSIIAASYR